MKRLMLTLAALIALATPAFADVEVQEITSPGGIDAWLVEEHTIPFVALELRFKGGATLDPEAKRGAVHLMTALIEEGAGEMDAQEFAAAREALAASYSFDAWNDGISVSARFLSENRDEAVALLREALINPRFDEDAVERVRGQVLSGLRSDATDPDKIASLAMARAAWGAHPYGSDAEGTLTSVAALTREDIVAAHRAALALDRVYVSAVGDITAEELGVLIDDLLGDLPAEGAPMVGEAEFQLEGGLTVLPFDTPQSIALFAHEGIPFDDPDFIPAYVLNEVFGGGAESRLNDEVREKRGLTYGIGTVLSTRQYGDMVIGKFATSGARMAEAVQVVRDEWARIAEEGLTEDELERAKLYLTGAYPLRFDSNVAIAEIMAGMQFQGQDAGYIARRNDLVNAVTLEDVNRVAKRIYRPEDLHFFVIGQPEGLTSE